MYLYPCLNQFELVGFEFAFQYLTAGDGEHRFLFLIPDVNMRQVVSSLIEVVHGTMMP